MSAPPDGVQLWVRKWVEKAEEDFTSAKHLLKVEENTPLETICFHAQQCVEKYLKALLTFFEIEFGKTHDLGYLLEKLPETNLVSELAACDVLIPYAVTTRYPGTWKPASEDEAEQAVEIAETIRRVARARLLANIKLEDAENK